MEIIMDTKSVTKRFFTFLGKIENSNKWRVNDGSDNDFEVINETKLDAKYYVEEVLETYKSILEI
jgi:hypothetical protein